MLSDNNFFVRKRIFILTKRFEKYNIIIIKSIIQLIQKCPTILHILI